MQQGERFFTIVTVLAIALIVQLALGYMAQRENPAEIAVEFTRAYFDLDPAMAEYLCSDFTSDEATDPVQAHIHQVADQAREVGFDLNYMRHRLFSVHTEILSLSEDEALVRITAQRKRNINPVYTLIARLFFLGDTEHVDETLKLIQEDGHWKVCGEPFSLSAA
ncbi:MAG TPA: hypothetical protein ACFCUC_07820 [Desulfobacterales bacterium]